MPKVTPAAQRSVPVVVRFRTRERDLLDRAGELAGETRSEFMRLAVLARARAVVREHLLGETDPAGDSVTPTENPR